MQFTEFFFSVAERDALLQLVLLRWGVGEVGEGSARGGAAGGALFGALRLGEGRIPSRDYAGRGRVPLARS